MQWRLPGLFVLLLCAIIPMAGPASAQANIVVKRFTVDIIVQPDGRYTKTVHLERSAMNSATADRIGQYAVAFNPSLERLDIPEAYTLKGDGTRKPVDAGAIRAQLAPGVPNVPKFADVQEKVVVFPDMAVGDTEVITTRTEIDHPLFPGQFFWAETFDRFNRWDDAIVTITAPRAYPLQTESFGVSFERIEQDDAVRYTWRYSTPGSGSDDKAISGWDYRPRLFASSFADYAAFAAGYEALAAPKGIVTPDIQAKADTITIGLDDRREQARALYEWVSGHIRYVALYLGRGGVEPHTADSVLGNGYGDCKDHVVLLEALLRAKGIESHAVLINLDTAYTLSTPPTMAQLNHVIAWLPEFHLFVDSTAAVAPFGTLPFREYGKPIIFVGVPGKVQGSIPVLRPDAMSMTVSTNATLEPNGRIFGNTSMTATGPAAWSLRLLARQAQSNGLSAAAARQLRLMGQTGRGNYLFYRLDDFAPTYEVHATFNLEPRQEILEGDAFAPVVGPVLQVRPGDFLLGPTNPPTLTDDDPTPCYAGQQVEELSLRLPDDNKPHRLPPDRRIDNEAFTYTSHWAFEDQTVTVRRELVSRVNQPLCQGALRREVAAALREIHRDHRAQIVLDVP
jgi:transglutaminase-like putative cysteine protease